MCFVLCSKLCEETAQLLVFKEFKSHLFSVVGWEGGSFLIKKSNNNNNDNNRIQRRNLRFFSISSLHRKLSTARTLKWPRRNRVQKTCNISSAYHVQRVMLCAKWYEGKAQLIRLAEFKPHLFELYFIG